MFDINELWWSLCSFLLQVIDGVSAVFYWLAGIRPATVDPNESWNVTYTYCIVPKALLVRLQPT